MLVNLQGLKRLHLILDRRSKLKKNMNMWIGIILISATKSLFNLDVRQLFKCKVIREHIYNVFIALIHFIVLVIFAVPSTYEALFYRVDNLNYEILPRKLHLCEFAQLDTRCNMVIYRY